MDHLFVLFINIPISPKTTSLILKTITNEKFQYFHSKSELFSPHYFGLTAPLEGC